MHPRELNRQFDKVTIVVDDCNLFIVHKQKARTHPLLLSGKRILKKCRATDYLFSLFSITISY